jgi:hypothetical protein
MYRYEIFSFKAIFVWKKALNFQTLLKKMLESLSLTVKKIINIKNSLHFFMVLSYYNIMITIIFILTWQRKLQISQFVF